MVIRLARKFHIEHDEQMIEDLCQEGAIGLLVAMDDYDHERGTCFITYASMHISAKINRYLIEYAGCVRIPFNSLRTGKYTEFARSAFAGSRAEGNYGSVTDKFISLYNNDNAFKSIDDKDEIRHNLLRVNEVSKKYLNPDDIKAIHMRYYENATYGEIGKEFKITQQAARKRLESAIITIKGAVNN